MTNLKTIFLGKVDRKRFPQKNPPHASPSKASNFITRNFWDPFCTSYRLLASISVLGGRGLVGLGASS